MNDIHKILIYFLHKFEGDENSVYDFTVVWYFYIKFHYQHLLMSYAEH